MRFTEASARPLRAGARRRLSAPVIASALSIALAGGMTVLGPPSASADPRPPTLPSRAQVHRAQTEAQEAAIRVAEIHAQMAIANAELHSAAVRAAQASEGYNGARWSAEQATLELRRASEDANRAERKLDRQRDRIAGVVTASYQDGVLLGAVEAVLGADGPQGLMTGLLADEGASTSMDAELQRFQATADLAAVFRAEAEKSRAEKLRLLDEAALAKDAAGAAAQAAQAVADSVAAQKTELVAELARLQGISVHMAEQRQSALEELERQRAVEAAARMTAVRVPQERRAQPREPLAQRQPDRPLSELADEPLQVTAPEAAPEPASAPVPAAPVDSTPPSPAGGASAAIAFARAQLGEPYVWGAAGPGSWDCSGLTMMAWSAGGKSLPHYSVAQHDATTPVPADRLRPGDLVFWGSTSSPSSIYHVALYLGDGLIIHAPRTGRPVTVDSMYYWVPPSFFGRV